MTDTHQKQLGNTLWSIADPLRGAFDSDDDRGPMLSLVFQRYFSDDYAAAVKKDRMQQLFPSPEEVAG